MIEDLDLLLQDDLPEEGSPYKEIRGSLTNWNKNGYKTCTDTAISSSTKVFC